MSRGLQLNFYVYSSDEYYFISRRLQLNFFTYSFANPDEIISCTIAEPEKYFGDLWNFRFAPSTDLRSIEITRVR